MESNQTPAEKIIEDSLYGWPKQWLDGLPYFLNMVVDHCGRLEQAKLYPFSEQDFSAIQSIVTTLNRL
jgi:hypothetical protein